MKDYRDSHQGDRKSRRYEEEIYGKGSYDDLMWERERPILLHEFEGFKKHHEIISYLDFGFGTGRITQLFEQRVQASVGVDISQSMIEIAKRKLSHTELVLADLTRNDILNGRTFDLITAFRVFLNAGPVMREDMMCILVPKLKKDGVMIFNFHGNILSYRIFTKIWLLCKGRHLNTVSYWEVKRFVDRHNLRIIRWYGLGVIPKIFYRFLGKRFMLTLDTYISKFPGSRYFAYNLIFVCEHK